MKAIFVIVLVALSQINAFDNLEAMNTLVEEINSKHSTWKAGINERFIGETKDQIKILLGVPMDKSKKPEKLPLKKVTVRNDLPENFDLRDKYPNCEALKEIRDQGSCGSCWAFSTAEVMSDRVCIFSNQTKQDRLSPLHLVSCCTECSVNNKK